MKMTLVRFTLFVIAIQCYAFAEEDTLRVAHYNIRDVRYEQLEQGQNSRLIRLAKLIQKIKPDILVLQELEYRDDCNHAQELADLYFAKSQANHLEGISYHAYSPESNTGIISNFDLNRDGYIASSKDLGTRQYGDDSWGYGEFPGKYAFAILVRDGLEIRSKKIRTFQHFLWKDLPKANFPKLNHKHWYSSLIRSQMRLSSKNHVDLPVLLPNGKIVHALVSHPTPPVFDGDEDRNGMRNHDEIRFWAEYLKAEAAIYDDRKKVGGLAPNAYFVILGDLNADPDEGDSTFNPIQTHLLNNPRVNTSFTPHLSATSDRPSQGRADIDDTTVWGMRVDYALPSSNLNIIGGSIELDGKISDHGMIWIDVSLP